jgi:hypothetical protein
MVELTVRMEDLRFELNLWRTRRVVIFELHLQLEYPIFPHSSRRPEDNRLPNHYIFIVYWCCLDTFGSILHELFKVSNKPLLAGCKIFSLLHFFCKIYWKI